MLFSHGKSFSFFCAGILTAVISSLFSSTRLEDIEPPPVEIRSYVVDYPNSCLTNSIDFKEAYIAKQQTTNEQSRSRILAMEGISMGGNAGGHAICIFQFSYYVYAYDPNIGSYCIGRASEHLLDFATDPMEVAKRLNSYIAIKAYWIEP